MSITKKLSLVAALAVALAAFSAVSLPYGPEAHAQAAPEPAEIRIGALVQYTQSLDDTNNLMAMNLAIDDINADPRIGPEYEVSLVPIDITRHVASRNLTGITDVVSQHLQDGIYHFVGPTGSTALGPVKLLSDVTPNMVVISPGSSAPVTPVPGRGIIDLAVPGDGVFRLVPTDAHHAEGLTDLMISESKQKVVMIIRTEWEDIDSIIPQSASNLFDRPLVTYTGAERFRGDDGAAIASHTNVANALEERLSQLVQQHGGPDNVAVAFIGLASDFDYHAGAIIQGGSAQYPNAHAVKWYSATLVGHPAVFSDAAVAGFAQDVNLTGPRYVVEDNNVNEMLCDRLVRQGGSCTPFLYSPYAAYDAVHLIVDSIVAEDERRNDGVAGNDLSARQLVIPIASGDESHRLAHDGRPTGDGALGKYELNAAGDLDAPIAYTILEASEGRWVPAIDDEIKIAFLSDFGHIRAFNYAVDAYNREQSAITSSDYQIASRVVETDSSTIVNDIRSLESEGFRYFVGPLTSSSAAAAKAYADTTRDIVLLSPSSTAASLAIAGDSLFRMVPDDDKQVPIIMGRMQGDGKEHVVLIYRDDTWGVGLQSSITTDYADMVALDILLNPDGSNAAHVAERAAAKVAELTAAHGADSVAVLLVSFDVDTIALVRHITSDAGLADTLGGVTWYGSDGASQKPDIARDAGVSAFLVSVGFAASQFEAEPNDLNRVIRGEFGGEASFADNTYDAVFLLADTIIINNEELAINPASTVRSLVLDVAGGLEDHDHHHAARTVGDGALGAFTLNAEGDLSSPLTYAQYELYQTPGGTHDWRIAVDPPARICR